MEQEIWKTIPEYEDYQVSNLGNVKSLKFGKEKLLKKYEKYGYFIVVVRKNNYSKQFKVHQLVAMAFLWHKPTGMINVINHINFNKADNRLENLEIISQRENASHKNKEYSSKHIGVCWDKENKKWISTIRINGKRIFLGRYEKELEASNAYKKKLKEIN